MSEVQHIDRVVQVGIEDIGDRGNAIAATKKLAATQLEFGATLEAQNFRPSGNKFPTTSQVNTEWVTGTLNGPVTYTELIYWLNSLVGSVSPSGSPDYTWSFTPASEAPGTPVTYTFEQGSSVRAQEFAYGLVTGLTMMFNRSEATLDGNVIGKAMSDDITLTSSLSAIDLEPVTVPQVQLYLEDSQGALGTATAITRGFSVEWSLTDRYNTVRALNGTTTWDVHAEIEPTLSARLLMAADATGMGLLTTMRNNSTKYMRIEATGNAIGTAGATYKLTIDSALRITEDPSTFQDEQGITAIEWQMTGFHNASWGKATQIDVVNELSSL